MAAPAPAKTGVPGIVVFWVILLVLLLGGGVGVGVWYVVKQRVARNGLTNTIDPMQAARLQISNCLLQSQAAGSNLLTWAGHAEQLCGAANKAVTSVLGPEQHDLMITLRLPAPKPALPAVVANTGTNAAGTNAVSSNAVSATAVSTAAAVAVAAPVDLVTDAMLKEPVMVDVRNMYRSWYTLDAFATETVAMYDEISAVYKAAGAMPPETLSLQAQAFNTRLQPFVAPDGVKYDEARRKLANMQHDLGSISNKVLDIKRRLERDEKKAQALADLAKAQAAAEQREAERKEKVKGEKELIAKKESEINDLLHRHNYTEARRQLNLVASALTDEESQKTYSIATQRVARLEELRDFLVARLPGVQLQSNIKVEAADRNAVVFRAGGGTNDVTWADMGDPRMVLFFKRVLMDEDVAHTIKLRDHVRMLVNATLYCRRFISDNPHVQLLRDKMAEKAIERLPQVKEDLEELFPGEKFGAGEGAP